MEFEKLKQRETFDLKQSFESLKDLKRYLRKYFDEVYVSDDIHSVIAGKYEVETFVKSGIVIIHKGLRTQAEMDSETMFQLLVKENAEKFAFDVMQSMNSNKQQ